MRIVVPVFLCLLVSFQMKGQVPVAGFTANVVSGCAPLSVSFTDQSTNSPKFWNWDFGNGQLSNLQNPVTVYDVPGVYTVTLVVRNNDGADGITKTNYIVVNPSPTAGFTADKTIGCAPVNVQFTDNSTANAGVLTEWSWNFGDGTTSTLQNPQKQYTAVGYYDVALTVKSSTGCSRTVVGYRYIRIVPGVKADFSSSTPVTCRPPFAVNFTNQTSGPGNLSYSWDLGNGNSSVQVNPSSTYGAAGNYLITLTAQSDFGCHDMVQKTITLSGTTTSFTGPDTVCLNGPATFHNTSSPTPVNSLWTFGDGSQSTAASPTKNYPVPGLYPVTLYSNFGKCVDSLTKNIRVLDKPTVDFSAPKIASCKAPFPVSFQDNSPDAVGWFWDFGDGITNTTKNPTHTYTTPGQFDVTLTITSSKGCQNTITKKGYIRIIAPSVSFINVPEGGCAPFNFAPIANINAIDGVASYLWDFGDGAGSTSTLPAPHYIYNNTGNYTISLTITTNDGCTATVSVPNGIKVGTPLVADFTSNVTSSCHSDSIRFFNTSTPTAGDYWSWQFGDGGTSIAQNPVYKYTDTGYHEITFIVYNNGCPDTVVKSNFIHTAPPIANFIDVVNCPVNKLSVDFTNKSITDPNYGAISYQWNFGDGSPVSSLQNPTNVYPGYGLYSVQLIANNGACSDTIKSPLKLVNEFADFSGSKATACKNDAVTFTAINSNPSNIIKYEWSINGGPPVVGSATYSPVFVATGNYSVTLTITDINGCTDTKTINNAVNITGPTAAFNVVNGGGCKNSPVQFNDASTSVNAIVKWTWDFGDGSPTSSLQNPSHTYADTGTYTVTLTVQDNLGAGCISTFSQTAAATVTKPQAFFGADTTLYCPGAPLQFKDSSSGKGLTWLWNFGDGHTSTQQNPTNIYSGSDSIYNIKLLVTDMYGCSDSITRNNYIHIKKPKPAFGVRDSSTFCPPIQTSFFFAGQDYQSFFWDFGDGSSSTLGNPTHFYNNYGSYTAKLYLVGYGGCLDSASSVINVYDPYTAVSISYSPITSCNDLTVDFSITVPAFSKFYLNFGDGSIDSSQQQTLQHFYSTPSFYSPSLFLTDSLGCQVAIGGPTTIRILGAEPIFGLDKKKFCDSGIIYFTNYTIGNDPVTSSTWDFGDGTTDNITKDAVHNYNVPGTYIPSLTVTTEAGCQKTLYDTVRIYRTPDPFITSDDAVCINNVIAFGGNLQVPDTAMQWKWDFGNGQTSTLQNPGIKYPQPNTYHVTLLATNSFGCKDTTSKNVVVNPLPVISVTGDTSFLVGLGVTIPMTYSPNVTSYNWSPPTNLSCVDCPNPFANPKFTTTYRVTVTDNNGCTSYRDVTVISLCNNKNFFVPNTFSPNHDGVNDWFYPQGKGIDRIQALRIFNRWGEMVFEKRNFPANSMLDGWDGTYKGKPAGVDTYVYLIDIICENAVIITYKGNVTLIR